MIWICSIDQINGTKSTRINTAYDPSVLTPWRAAPYDVILSDGIYD
jgi:hypothetical protein